MDMTVPAIVAAAIGFVFAVIRLRTRVGRSDVRRVERKLDLVIKHLGLEKELQPRASERVLMHLSAGNVIQAIKAYRDENPDAGLKEAKEAVEEIQRNRGR